SVFVHRSDDVACDYADHVGPRVSMLTGTLIDPRNELTASRVPGGGNQAGPSALELIDRQVNGFGIKFCVVQECQLAKPSELAIAAGESACEPIGDVDANETLAGTSVL